MFSGAILNDPLFHIELTLGEGQFETAITHVRINDLWNNTSGTEVSLQNILKISTKCNIHGINKIFVSNVLNTHKIFIAKSSLSSLAITSSLLKVFSSHHYNIYFLKLSYW